MNENYTWVFDNHRLYIHTPNEGTWNWNLRSLRWGWDLNGTSSKLQSAMIDALDILDRVIANDYVISFPIIYDNNEKLVHYHPDTLVKELLSEQITGESHFEIQTFELRTKKGYLCNPEHPVQLFNREENLPLHLNKK